MSVEVTTNNPHTKGVGLFSFLVAPIRMHRYLPLAVLYFFFDTVGLPKGLYYTTILTPLFYLYLLREKKRWVTVRFLACLAPFAIAHVLVGIESPFYYFRSTVLLWTVYVITYAFYWGMLKTADLERLFDQLILLNFGAAMVAVVLRFTPLWNVVWNDSTVIEGTSPVIRLQLLTYEPSGYAALMMPLLVFAGLRLITHPGRRSFYYATLIVIPFLLCQSFGGISMCVAGLAAAMLINYRNLLHKRGALISALAISLLVAILFLSHNAFSVRLLDALAGNDSSTRTRTTGALVLAYMIASAKSIWWGAGLGQAKVVGAPITALYRLGFDAAIIPNATLGTFAEFGLVGVAVRFFVEGYLFFRTRVYTNQFRMAMFVAAFFMQLTGSNLMSESEYVVWAFAFGAFFPEMNVRQRVERKTANA